MYDTIVLGVGGVGSSALFHLASRGVKVLGIDRFAPGHDRGSSHGRTRLIRQAYYEHPDYVPLVQRAYQLWAELSQLRGQHLYHEVGVLQAGPRDGAVVAGVLASAKQHGLDVEELSAAAVAKRFPGFRMPESAAVVFERRAGYLEVEHCVTAYAAEAVRRGAELRTGETVLSWRVEGDGVAVETDQGAVRARSLIVTAGAWASQMLTDLGIRFEVVRKSLYWYDAPAKLYGEPQGSPGFLFETPQGNFYGFPRVDAMGLKVAEHTRGLPVTDPLNVDRRLDAEETARVEQFLLEYLPHVSMRNTDFATCLYTLSPDRHFVLDLHPRHPQVSFAAGLSGHGFKFASVLGEALADLSQHRNTRLPIGFLSSQRPAIH
jgi:sarcosine oxidase